MHLLPGPTAATHYIRCRGRYSKRVRAFAAVASGDRTGGGARGASNGAKKPNGKNEKIARDRLYRCCGSFCVYIRAPTPPTHM